jgi:hypothetical protein
MAAGDGKAKHQPIGTIVYALVVRRSSEQLPIESAQQALARQYERISD